MEYWMGSLMAVGLLLLSACSNDSVSDRIETSQDNLLYLSSVTRAASQYTPDVNSNIKIYVMTETTLYSVGNFTYGNSWASNDVSVGEHAQYYMYGYMPGTYDSEIDLNGNYSKECDLTIKNLPIFTSEDIYAIVGVQRISTTEEPKNIIEGNYGYLSGLNSENYVNLLMDHLYSKLILKINVDADYNLLRDIKLKSATLTCSYGETVNVLAKFRTGYGLQENATAYSANSGGTKQEHPLWTSTEQSGTLIPSDANEDEPLSLGSVNCPPAVLDAAGTYMKITCAYDVYDKAGNKLRECTVDNKMKTTNVSHGMEYTVTLTVAPTYIYVLSDDDLNNPTIIVN